MTMLMIEMLMLDADDSDNTHGGKGNELAKNQRDDFPAGSPVLGVGMCTYLDLGHATRLSGE